MPSGLSWSDGICSERVYDERAYFIRGRPAGRPERYIKNGEHLVAPIPSGWPVELTIDRSTLIFSPARQFSPSRSLDRPFVMHRPSSRPIKRDPPSTIFQPLQRTRWSTSTSNSNSSTSSMTLSLVPNPVGRRTSVTSPRRPRRPHRRTSRTLRLRRTHRRRRAEAAGAVWSRC